jgi:DNA-binding FadR family transcriptional regulator
MRAHQTVLSWVRGQLASGALNVGDRLPGERLLAEQLGLSRSAVREGLRILEALGTVTSATGSGPKSGTIIVAQPQEALGLALSLQLSTRQVRFEDVVQTRLLLETWAATHARPDYDDWADAASLLERTAEPDLPVEQYLRLDAAFHAELARAAGNPLIATLMDGLRSAIADHTLERSRALPDWPTTADRLHTEHAVVLAALQEGRCDEAADLLQRHILGYWQLTERHHAGSPAVSVPMADVETEPRPPAERTVPVEERADRSDAGVSA